MMERINTPMLVKICHKGISVIPNLTMVWMGAVMGNIVSTTHTGLFGNAGRNPRNQSGTKLAIV